MSAARRFDLLAVAVAAVVAIQMTATSLLLWEVVVQRDGWADRAASIAALVSLAVVTPLGAASLALTMKRQREARALRDVARANDEFVGFVSHEIRTPAAVIAGNARLLAEAGGELIEVQAEAVGEIARAAERLEAIVVTLLSLAKAEGGGQIEVEPILIQRIVDRAIRDHVRRFPQRRMVVTAGDDLPPASGDRNAVEQVLLNLLANAEKYGAADAPIVVTAEAQGGTLVVGVCNAGDALDQNVFERVFEPFFRLPASVASAPGVGLGLTVSHRLIAAQGGQLAAEALPGGGACFRFTLPTARLDEMAQLAQGNS